jgi:hypothetical protein|tara:strand:+ start:1674 stop:2159 length:486 start_codon:yes stop_codon:yes gene_type:complete
MLDKKYTQIVTHVVHQLVSEFDVSFLIIENLSVSHQPSRKSKSLVGYTVISSDVRVRNLTSDGLKSILVKGKDVWFDNDVIDGVMKCMGLIVDGGVRVTKSLTTDQRQQGLKEDGFGDSKMKSSLMTYFSFVRLSEKDLRQRVELVWKNFLEDTDMEEVGE